MNCREAAGHLDAFLDSTLDAESLRRINGHLSECPGCRRRFNAEGRIQRAAAAQLRAEAMPAGVWDRMLTAIDDAERRSGRRRPEWLRPGPAELSAAVRWVGGCAVACASLLLAANLLTPSPPPPPIGPAAIGDGVELAHRHNRVPSLAAFRAGRPDPQDDLDAELARFLPPAPDGRPPRLHLPDDPHHHAFRVHHEVLTLETRSVLHVAFNCCGGAASVFVIPDFTGAADMVAEIKRKADAAGQAFGYRRAGVTWTAAVADDGHDPGYLLDAFVPGPPRAVEPAAPGGT